MSKQAKISYSFNIEMECTGTFIDRISPSTLEGFVAGILKNAGKEFYANAKKEFDYLSPEKLTKEVKITVDISDITEGASDESA